MRSLVGLLAHLPGKVAVFILLCGLSGAFAHAADDASEYAFPESFKIRVSSFHIFNADSDIAVFGSSGVGASIDFDKDLGGENDITVPRIDGYYRFNQHWTPGAHAQVAELLAERLAGEVRCPPAVPWQLEGGAP